MIDLDPSRTPSAETPMTANTEAVDLFAFDNSYARLPDRFSARLHPTPVATPRLVRLNQKLASSIQGSLPHRRVWRSSRETVCPGEANRSPGLMLATSSGRSYLSFPKIPSGRIRVVTENQRIIAFDARDPPLACSIYRQPIQVAASA